MKTLTLAYALPSVAALTMAVAAIDRAPSSSAQPERIAIYDSRALAYAHFWLPAECARRDALAASARAAAKTGDRTRQKALARELEEMQAHTHPQVFSTAPATEALEALALRLPALQDELGVTRLVSKWDEPTLRTFGTAERIDVTDRLVREFITPSDPQQKTLAAMKTKPPLPLWKTKVLRRFGLL